MYRIYNIIAVFHPLDQPKVWKTQAVAGFDLRLHYFLVMQ